MPRSHKRPLSTLLALLASLLVPAPSPAASPESATEELLGVAPVQEDIAELLRDTRERYGADAVILQVQLLQYAVQAGSILPAGVRVRGVEVHNTHRYVVFSVETGMIFNSRDSTQQSRMHRVWSDIVIPTLGRLTTCDVPADGIALELSYFHRPYQRSTELQETAESNPGRGERAALHLLRRDILAFRRQQIDAPELFSRSSARTDELPAVPFPGRLP